MGHLVDMGPPPYSYAGPLAYLRQLSDAAEVFDQRTNSGYGGSRGNYWRAGRAPGLFFDLVFPHAASVSGDRRWRFSRSAYGARTAHQLGCFSLPCLAALLDALSAGIS